MAEALSTYERLAAERENVLWSVVLPPLLAAALVGIGAYLGTIIISLDVLALPAMVVSSLLAYGFGKRALEALWPWYSKSALALRGVEAEISRISHRVAEMYGAVPKRSFGAQFKKHYDLSGREVEEFERLLAIGMRHERREVWVTAFCRDRRVVRVTATIGSVYRCRPSDNVATWPQRADELSCTAVRQYHNHPGSCRSTSPSPSDRLTSQAIERLFNGTGIDYQNYIVYWNEIGEFRILRYDGDGSRQPVRVFDGAA